MISIKRPYIENENGKSRLCAEIAIAPEIMKSGKSRLEAAENMRDMKKRTVTGKINFNYGMK